MLESIQTQVRKLNEPPFMVDALSRTRKGVARESEAFRALANDVVDFVSTEATQVVDEAEPAQLHVDAADALVVGEALAGQAELFVTGDAALLRLNSVQAVKIISPRQLWETLRT